MGADLVGEGLEVGDVAGVGDAVVGAAVARRVGVAAGSAADAGAADERDPAQGALRSPCVPSP